MTQQKRRGPRSKYDPKTTPQLVKWMARSGLIETEIAAGLEISPSTLTRWKQRYPEVANALNESRDFVDSLVEDSLLKRALGYKYEETKMVIIGDTGDEEKQKRRIEKTTKQVAPDVTAQIFWLKNRKPVEWRDKQDIEHSADDPLLQFVDAIREAREARDAE